MKSPKIFINDAGLLHALLDISTRRALERHPKLGASWEGFVLTQVIRQLRARSSECYFWAIHAGAALDLLVISGARRYGFEIKRTDSPRISSSMRAAVDLLKLDRLDLIHAGSHTFSLRKNIRAVAAADILNTLGPLRGD